MRDVEILREALPGQWLRITATPGPNPGQRFTVSVTRRSVRPS